MLELNARNFMACVDELARIQAILNGIPDKGAVLGSVDKPIIEAHLTKLNEAMQLVGARSAFRPVERLQAALADSDQFLTYQTILSVLGDITSRFGDHLDDIRLFVIPQEHSVLFDDATRLMGGDDTIVFSFPSATFELEESAKCLALGRPTAAAFHAIRMLEIGIDGLRRHLNIPEPVKTTDRSWGKVLGSIKDEMDNLFPKQDRHPGTYGCKLESLYATLDAVKNPWRNSTMHVETIYTDADARHILANVVAFMTLLMEICDEEGEPKTWPSFG
jgi:hypothetical protein